MAGWPGLSYYAARNGCLIVVQVLLEIGVNVDSKENSGRTLPLYAAKNGISDAQTISRASSIISSQLESRTVNI